MASNLPTPLVLIVFGWLGKGIAAITILCLERHVHPAPGIA